MTATPPPLPNQPRPASPDDAPTCTYCRGWRAVLLLDSNLGRYFVCRTCDFAANPYGRGRFGPPNAG